MTEFHNPYNFVPALPRADVRGDLGDHAPVDAHSRWADEGWSGRIRVSLTTITPLLVPDASRMTEDSDSHHKTFPVREGPDGRPRLAVTSVKGMLRAAYETVTNSRMGIFRGHDRPLGRRMATQEALSLVPARIEERAGRLQIRLMSAARLRQYPLAQPLSLGSLPDSKQRVDAHIQWGKVVDIFAEGTAPAGVGSPVTGWVHATNWNIKGKSHERLFFNNMAQPEYRELTEEILTAWEDLITDYQEAHDEEDVWERKRPDSTVAAPEEYLGADPGKTAWSPHVYQDGNPRRDNKTPQRDAKALVDGTLCYAKLGPGEVVERLYPVLISRDLFPVAPEKLLDASLKAPKKLDELSPADRVFGWAHPDGHGAHRAQVRIGTIWCERADAIEPFALPGVPLAVLGQPKPQQGRFYVAKSPRGEAQEKKEKGLTPIDAGYHPGKGLRGRKVYPHHKELPTNYWQNPAQDRTQRANGRHYQEYRRPKGARERDGQNRSILGWVKPNTRFTFTVDVLNLSSVELGALLWLSSL